MSLVPDASESTIQDREPPQKRTLVSSVLHLPRNVYILLTFTTGKGFQLSLSALTLNYYVHSLGYQPDFIGIFSAMPAIGALISAVPVGLLADRLGRKPVLLLSAILTPLFLAACGLVTSPFLLLFCAFMQGVVSTAYWVTNLPLLTESTTERQRVGVFALNSFLLLGIGALGSLLGGAIPEFVGHVLHVSAGSPVPLRWGVLLAASSTFVFGLPLWFLHEPKRAPAGSEAREQEEAKARSTVPLVAPIETATPQSGVLVAPVENAEKVARDDRAKEREREWLPALLFVKLLTTDLLFTMGE